MTVSRYYNSSSQRTTLYAEIPNGSSETMRVAGDPGFPDNLPFTVIINKDQANEEVVEVDGVVGSSAEYIEYHIVRNIEPDVTAKPHSIGETVEHGVSGRDFRESRQHEDAATKGVHGLNAGDSVVGWSTAATLTGKVISGASNSISNIPQSAVTGLSASLAGKSDVGHLHAITDVTDLQTTIDSINTNVSAVQADVDAIDLTGYATSTELSTGLATKLKKPSANGIVVKIPDGDGEVAVRSLVEGDNISIANPTGLSGDMEISVVGLPVVKTGSFTITLTSGIVNSPTKSYGYTFASKPAVFLSINDGQSRWFANPSDIQVDTFVANIRHFDNTTVTPNPTVTVNWIAVLV